MQFWNHWFTMKCRAKTVLANTRFGKICKLFEKKKSPIITNPTFPVDSGGRQCPDKLEFTISGQGSTTDRIHSSSNQEVGEGIGLLPNWYFLSPDHTTLGSAGLEVLVLKEGILLPDNIAIVSLSWKVREPLGRCGLWIPQNQKAKKVVTVLTGVSDPDFHGEIGLLP